MVSGGTRRGKNRISDRVSDWMGYLVIVDIQLVELHPCLTKHLRIWLGLGLGLVMEDMTHTYSISWLRARVVVQAQNTSSEARKPSGSDMVGLPNRS